MYDGFPRFFSLTLKSARITTDQNKQMFFKRYSWIKAKQQQKYRNLNGIQMKLQCALEYPMILLLSK